MNFLKICLLLAVLAALGGCVNVESKSKPSGTPPPVPMPAMGGPSAADPRVM